MKRLFQSLLAMAVSAVLSVLLLEAALHLYFRVNGGYWLFLGQDNFKVPFAMLVPDARVYSLRPNSKYEIATIGPLGFRESPPPPTGKDAICVLGDSVPFGAGVADNGSLPFHLQQWADRAGWAPHVLNAAIPSYTWNQAFLRWKIDVSPRYRCKLFIVSAANDATLMLFYKSRWKPASTWAERNLNMQPVRLSAIRYFVDLAVEKLGTSAADENYLSKDLPEFDQNLRVIVGEMAAVAPVIVLPITACYYTDRPLPDPSNLASCDHYKGYKENAENWGAAVNGVNERLQALKGQPNVFFVDTAKFLDRDRSGYFADGMHFSDKGAKAVADYLAGVIESTEALRQAVGR